MMSDLPKVLHPVAGRAMVEHVCRLAAALEPERVVVVVGPGMETVAAAVAPVETCVQRAQRGTADAVMAARDALAGFTGDVVV
ncbi:NTP transferase domain-containing protein, partial [Escherichia coli]|nr:NTP transferase domain-containing protein [Escherichia coli]